MERLSLFGTFWYFVMSKSLDHEIQDYDYNVRRTMGWNADDLYLIVDWCEVWGILQMEAAICLV